MDDCPTGVRVPPPTHEAGTTNVPLGAAYVEGITVTVNWDAQGWGLAPVTTTFGGPCQTGLPPQ